MAALGFVVVRWFVFADGRAGIVYDDTGLPAGLDPHFFADLDVALEIARGTGIALNLVLLDHRWMFEGVRETIADPATGALLEASLPHGRARVLESAAGRRALFDHVLAPLVTRYGHTGTRADLSRSIFAFELMNEPDFVIEEWERDVSSHVARPLKFEALADVVAALSDLVHARTAALSTMSAARSYNLWAWDDPELGLDVLQVHSYPDVKHPERDIDLFGTRAAALRVSRPLILGEFPGDAPEQHPPDASPPATTLEQYLEFAVTAGYAGAWPWSFSGTDAYGSVPEEPLRAFASRHPELVNSRAGAQEDEREERDL
jgi:hypothetical protein